MVEILQNKENFDKIEFTASENGEQLGRCAGILEGDTFVFDELECGDFFIDGLVRAVLNLMDIHGIERARFKLEDNEVNDKLRKLGFVYNDEKIIYSIADFFAENKKCKKL